jgi:hypothetical protein
MAQHAPALENRAKSLELAEEAYRERFREIHFHYEGSLLRIARLPGWEPYQRENQKKRGLVGGFSIKARGRLIELCARIRRDAMALFVTLTYPRAWSGDPQVWKRDLDAFGKWLRRGFAGCSFIWKLEPQQRERPIFIFSCLVSRSYITRPSRGVGSRSSAAKIRRTLRPARALKRSARVMESCATRTSSTWEKTLRSRRAGNTSDASGA